MLETIQRDPAVAGAVLTGSKARDGMSTRWSDHDVFVIAHDGRGTDIGDRRTATLDVVAMGMAEFRRHALPGSGSEWNRYAFVGARVVHDTPEGLIAELVARKTTLTPEEADSLAAGHLDAFVNSAYRALKNHRDGHPLAGHLDAAEAAPPLLTHVFALERRVRPYNKYLAWELAQRPLAAPAWREDRLSGLLGELVAHGRPDTLRRLFTDVEPLARAAGHGPVLDAWGDDLLLLRGTAEPGPEADSYHELP
ncbi:hypothetical protein E1283_16025 [Streptomyces hainanensis]|uniref:Nucleotidyltransferase domain-containing protein n=1 Tax=Streptomyces hainanensis TaxID=402648 RepID=A0A4R4TGK6_9ACTN|nr:hypothetical protein E1283_16025 [Streptomyces hainanensis]